MLARLGVEAEEMTHAAQRVNLALVHRRSAARARRIGDGVRHRILMLPNLLTGLGIEAAHALGAGEGVGQHHVCKTDHQRSVLEELGLFDKGVVKKPEAMFVNFGEKEALYALKSIQALRGAGIRAELYPSDAKMKKQMNYAHKREIPFVVLAGEEEMKAGKFAVKDMRSGEQKDCNQDELMRLISTRG